MPHCPFAKKCTKVLSEESLKTYLPDTTAMSRTIIDDMAGSVTSRNSYYTSVPGTATPYSMTEYTNSDCPGPHVCPKTMSDTCPSSVMARTVTHDVAVSDTSWDTYHTINKHELPPPPPNTTHLPHHVKVDDVKTPMAEGPPPTQPQQTQKTRDRVEHLAVVTISGHGQQQAQPGAQPHPGHFHGVLHHDGAQQELQAAPGGNDKSKHHEERGNREDEKFW